LLLEHAETPYPQRFPLAQALTTTTATTAAAVAAAAGCVQALLTAGATIDLPMLNPSRQHSELPVVNGSTPLHLAAEYGHTAIAALLLHAHVDRMERRLPAHLENHREDQEWLPWEGAPNQDPRVRRNVSGDTPHS
jgi:ankyrin repeat protein